MSKLSPTALLLNTGHALDHLFLLIFATAVAAIAADWGMVWQDLMPYTVGAFVMFGLGSLPAGRLGDLWGRRAMMVIFFLGIGSAAILVALTSGVWSLAAALTLMGAFASIYHPVGIPMLVQNAQNPGFTIGVNGLAGNLGIALAAVLTGFLVQLAGWRAAFAVGNDTGPTHLVAACGCPTLALFGASRGDWSRPHGNHTDCLRACRGLESECLADGLCHAAPPTCLEGVSPEAVLERALSVLRRAADEPRVIYAAGGTPPES